MARGKTRSGGASPPSPAARESPADRGTEDATEYSRLLGDIEPLSPGHGAGDAASRKNSWNGYDDFEGLPWWRRPSVYWLLLPYSVFTLAFGGIMVPKLNLIRDLVCKQYFADQTIVDPTFTGPSVRLGSDNPECKLPGVQKNAASFLLVMNLCTGILSAITAPKLGHLSDRYGRRKLLALASSGGLLAELITILAAKFPESVDYRWLILGSVFDGLTGSFTAGSILSQSYTSDCSPPSKRAVSIGYLHACLFTGLALGPLLTGYFVEWTGSLLSIFYVVLGCHTFFILTAAFVIPESLSKQKRLAAQEKWEREQEARPTSPAKRWFFSNSMTNPFLTLKSLVPTGPGTSLRLRINLVALAMNDFVILGCAMAAGQVIILYSEYQFGWGNFEASRFVSALSMVRVFALMGVFPIINYFGRVRPARREALATGITPDERNSGADRLDIWILRIALISDIMGCVAYTLARDESLFFGGGMLTAMGGLGSATIQAVITKHVPADRIGQLLGAVGMLHAMARVVGPVLFNGLYSGTVETFPQAVFVLLASLFATGFLVSFAIKPHVHWEEPLEDEAETEPLNTAAQVFRSENDRLPIDEDQVLIQPS